MAELGDGIFVTKAGEADWEPDDEVGGSVHLLFEEGDSMGGLWKVTPDSGPLTPPELSHRETIVILEGSTTIVFEGGPTLELSKGDIASLPKGARTTWTPSDDFVEVWLYS